MYVLCFQSGDPNSVFPNGLAEQCRVESVVLVTTRELSVPLTGHQMENMSLSRAVVTSFWHGSLGRWASVKAMSAFTHLVSSFCSLCVCGLVGLKTVIDHSIGTLQPYWQPHNRAVARRIQNMGWRADGGLWLLVRGGGLYLSKGTGVSTSTRLSSLSALCIPWTFPFLPIPCPLVIQIRYLILFSTVVIAQITEEFEEVPVQSRGFGILDVGYRSEVYLSLRNDHSNILIPHRSLHRFLLLFWDCRKKHGQQEAVAFYWKQEMEASHGTVTKLLIISLLISTLSSKSLWSNFKTQSFDHLVATPPDPSYLKSQFHRSNLSASFQFLSVFPDLLMTRKGLCLATMECCSDMLDEEDSCN